MAEVVVFPPVPGQGTSNAGGWIPGIGSSVTAVTSGAVFTYPVLFIGPDVPGGLDQQSVTAQRLNTDNATQQGQAIWDALSTLATRLGYSITRSNVSSWQLQKGL